MTPESVGERPVFPTDLPETDGESLESDWHRLAINLLLDVIWYHFRDRRDFFRIGGTTLFSLTVSSSSVGT